MSSCLVCGRISSEDDSCVKRRIEKDSSCYQEIFEKILVDACDDFQNFCKICDRLINEFEEASKEKKSLHLEIEFRLSHKNSDEYDDDADSTLGIDEDYIEQEEEEEIASRTLDDEHIENVKIIEINVKPEVLDNCVKSVVEPKKREVVITKFEHKTVNKSEINLSPDDWSKIFCNHTLTESWKLYVTDLLLPKVPDCNLDVDLREFESNNNSFYFQVNCDCLLPSCPIKVSIESSSEYNLSVIISGSPCHGDQESQVISSVIDTAVLQEYVCPDCGKRFLSVQERNLHHSEIHGQYICQKCNKEFMSEVGLNIHVKQCKFGDLLKCQYCLKSFSNKRNLKDHINVLHCDQIDNENSRFNFECQHCGKKFYKKFNLTSHLLRHTSEKQC